MKRFFFVLLGCSLACSESKLSSGGVRSSPGSGSIFARNPAQLPESSRFKKIRKLLAKDPDSAARAYYLYPLVDPICTSTKTRIKFVADAAAYVHVRKDPDDRAYARRLAIDTLEHVSSSCWRNYPPAAYQILEASNKVITGTTRFDVITARLKAAAADFENALLSAEKARKAGSIHAIALSANIHAQIARQSTTSYKSGMFHKAIEILSVPPSANWPLIDLTAVLSSRGRLLNERANWESGETQKKTLQEARDIFRRLSVGPFIEVTRRHALDTLCYDAVLLGDDSIHPCSRAAKEFQNLGAAMLSGSHIKPPTYDQERYKTMLSIRSRIDKMKKGKVVILAARGDEHEVIAWTRPAATALSRLKKVKPALIVLDRTSSKRASATLDRIIELSGLVVKERIDAGRDTFAMPCLAAIVAGRRTPKACPFDKDLINRLIKMPAFGIAFLVGRDLDAEIDDLRLYDLETVLLSYRKSLTQAGVKAHLKDLSDTWIFSPNAQSVSGTLTSNAKP